MAGFSSDCVCETGRATEEPVGCLLCKQKPACLGIIERESYIFTLVSMAGGVEYKTLRGKVQYEISSTSLSALTLPVPYALSKCGSVI